MTITFNDVNFPTFKLRMRSGSKCREFAHRLDVLKSASYRPEKQPGSDFGMHVQLNNAFGRFGIDSCSFSFTDGNDKDDDLFIDHLVDEAVPG